MKDIVFKRRTLVLITSGVVALLVVSVIVENFVLHSVQTGPNPTGATETSGCATPLAPRENMLYVLASQRISPQTSPPLTPLGPVQGPLYISAVDTNGRQSWMQQFTTFSPDRFTNASLEVRNGIVYAFATHFVLQSNHIVAANIVAAYDANSGKQLWGIQVKNANVDVSSPVNNAIVGMSICNNRMYLWTQDALYAYNVKNGSLLWQDEWLPWKPFQMGSNPLVEVTDTAIVFASSSHTAMRGNYLLRDENAINALNSKNGVPLWKVSIPAYSPSQGLSFAATDRAVYIDVLHPGSPQKVEALSISTGKQLWNTSVGKPIADDFYFPSAVVGNNVLYVSTNNYGVVAINANDGRHLWQDNTISELKPLQDKLYVNHTKMGDVFTKSDFCQLDPVTGKSQWCNSYADDPLGRATSDQTTVYIPLVDGVHALQKNNGNLKWIYKGNISGTALTVTDGLSFDY
ncbi:MAG TPA: PQQ-binding-like beta-propeller repeat protein [Ktedonobacteraceae bacterium]|jgi:outer membrane protein assembly factor BamB|nr:PQQ-binding-like beta-propeller repeat protein [Ktedonobacteraceae bacterium]